MGSYVDRLSLGSVSMPDVIPTEAPTTTILQVDPSSPWWLVNDRFTSSSDIANEFKLLITSDTGLLQQMADTIVPFDNAYIDGINYTSPLIDDIQNALSWYESAFPSTLADAVQTKLMNDLINGATGVGGTVEQDIFDRDVARMAEEEALIQEELEERLSSAGFDLPTGALNAALQEHENKVAMRVLDTSQKISAEQADLAQKNNQFAVNASIQLDTMLRNFAAGIAQRSLDYKKALAAHIIAAYDLYLRDEKNKTDAEVSKGDIAVRGYQAEYGLRVEVAKALTAAAMQAFASAFGAVNASAGLSYTGSESVGESISHSTAVTHQSSVSLSGNVQASIGNSLTENYEGKI